VERARVGNKGVGEGVEDWTNVGEAAGHLTVTLELEALTALMKDC